MDTFGSYGINIEDLDQKGPKSYKKLFLGTKMQNFKVTTEIINLQTAAYLQAQGRLVFHYQTMIDQNNFSRVGLSLQITACMFFCFF